MNIGFLSGVTSLCFFSLCACTGMPAQQLVTTCDGVPAYRVIAPNGNASILLGSLHAATLALKQPDDSVLDGKRHFVIEHLHEPSYKSPLNGWEPEIINATTQFLHASWARSIPLGYVDEIKKRTACRLQSMNSEDQDFELLANSLVENSLRMKTAYFAADLAIYPCSEEKELKSRDDLMFSAASARSIPKVGLESAAEVDFFRSQVPNEILVKTIMNIFSKDVEEAFSGVIEALNSGDYAAFQKAMRKASADPKYDAVHDEVMVAGRNKLWTPRLMKYLDEGNAFVIVGASHIPGAQGLVSLLKDHGYKSESTCLPAREVGQ